MKQTIPHTESTLYVTDRKVWRAWLAENYNKKQGVWLLYPKKASGKPRISYNDAVEEALCFGWIDSKVKTFDENSYAQRFSPRNPKNKYSQANKEGLRHLVSGGLVLPAVQTTLEEALSEEFTIPQDILKEIKTNKVAWENFQNFSPAYQRIRIAFIEGARKRPAEFNKRLKYFLKMTEKNKQFGFGGIEKYF